MRWVPLLLILTLAGLGGLFAILNLKETNKRYFALISVVYLTCLGAILFTPISFDGVAIYVMPAGVGRVNLSRLYLHGSGFIENIILTIPLGVLVKKLVPQLPVVVMGVLGVITGAMIESLQYYLSHHWLINRSSDINDVIANALGVIIGGIIIAGYYYIHNKEITE